jgi:hypothetical protein
MDGRRNRKKITSEVEADVLGIEWKELDLNYWKVEGLSGVITPVESVGVDIGVGQNRK